MKYNTPLQRKKIYQRVLKVWELKQDNGEYMGYLCGTISEVADIEMQQIKGHFPEFMAQKPKKTCGNCWWTPETEVRIKALKAAIKLCK